MLHDSLSVEAVVIFGFGFNLIAACRLVYGLGSSIVGQGLVSVAAYDADDDHDDCQSSDQQQGDDFICIAQFAMRKRQKVLENVHT
jgi:hypothetical protein